MWSILRVEHRNIEHAEHSHKAEETPLRGIKNQHLPSSRWTPNGNTPRLQQRHFQPSSISPFPQKSCVWLGEKINVFPHVHNYPLKESAIFMVIRVRTTSDQTRVTETYIYAYQWLEICAFCPQKDSVVSGSTRSEFSSPNQNPLVSYTHQLNDLTWNITISLKLQHAYFLLQSIRFVNHGFYR